GLELERARDVHGAEHVRLRLRLRRRGPRVQRRVELVRPHPRDPVMRAAVALAVALAGGCASSDAPDPGLEALTLKSVKPGTVLPRTKPVLHGDWCGDDPWGATTLHLVGRAGGHDIDVSWSTKFVDFSTMTLAADGGKIDEIGGDVDFDGTAKVEVVATSNGQ